MDGALSTTTLSTRTFSGTIFTFSLIGSFYTSTLACLIGLLTGSSSFGFFATVGWSAACFTLLALLASLSFEEDSYLSPIFVLFSSLLASFLMMASLTAASLSLSFSYLASFAAAFFFAYF